MVKDPNLRYCLLRSRSYNSKILFLDHSTCYEALLKCLRTPDGLFCHIAKDLLLNGGWTSKSPADGNKFFSLPKCICSQENASSCLGKGLSSKQRSSISGTDYSGRDHITVEDCFWIARLVMKHSFSVSELQTVCSVHVANDPSQVVSVHYVRDSGVVIVEVLDS